MSATDREQDKPAVTHTTHIDSVAGQVHTGSGNIIVGDSSGGGTFFDKEEFLSVIREFKAELEAARREGLPEEAANDALTEVETAEREAAEDTPKAERIVKRLENAKAVLVAGTGVATAATAATAAVGKLIPLIETAIQTVSRIL